MNPLEDIIVAMRPLSPRLPFALPTSSRPNDVTHTNLENVWITDMTNPVVNQGNLGNMSSILNADTNFGWEYVWHCHILGHEENDFMRPLRLNVASSTPAAPSGLTATAAAPTRVDLAWTDNSTDEVGFTVERSLAGANNFAKIGVTVPDENRYQDMTASTGTGYDYRVIAYNQAGDSAAPSNTVNITATSTPPVAAGVTLTPSLSSPQPAGSPIVFTAAGQGSFGFVYRFWLWNGVWWNKVQDWSATPTWTLPASSPMGSYQVQVDVSTVAGSPFQEALAQVNYTLTAPVAPTPVSVQLTPSLPSPQTQSTPVVFTAVGSGGSNFMYRFWVNNGVWWNKVQDWSITNTYALDTAYPIGTYQVQVDVSTNPVTPVQEALATANYALVAAAPLALVSSVASPQAPGTEVLFTASGPGSTAHVYRFWLWNGVWWQKVQDWSANPLWLFPATKPAGSYTVQVDVSSNTAAPSQDAMVQQNFTIQ